MRIFLLFCTHYFDDFSVVEFSAIADQTQHLLDDIFGLLGWPTKEPQPFGVVFEPLGVVVSMQRASEGIVSVTNKASRLEELRRFQAEAAEKGAISVHDVRRFRGRFVHARGQVFARCGAPALVAHVVLFVWRASSQTKNIELVTSHTSPS